MKTKIFKLLSAIIIILVAISNLKVFQDDHNLHISLSDIAVMAKAEDESGGQNQATCYSTYTEPGFLGTGTTIWVCGSCVQIKAKNHYDPNICYF